MGSSSGALHACDPLSAQPTAIRIEHIAAAGRDANGTVYVAASKKAGGEVDLVFVSEGNTLVRRRVLGTGSSSGDDSAQWTVSFEDAQPSRLVFEVGLGSPVIGLVHDADKTFLNQLDGDFTKLTRLTDEQVLAMPTRNLPGATQLELMAHTDDGQRLVVTRPVDDASYDDFRLFMGRDGTLDEHTISNASRGSATWITFAGQGGDYDAVFSSIFAPSIASTLKQGAQTWSLTLDDVTQGVPSGTTFRCVD